MKIGLSNLLLLAASVSTMTGAALVPSRQTPPKPKVSFSRDILPILSDRCFKCHGPDATDRMANLRLDDPQSAFASRHNQWAIVPGHPESSLVFERIHSATSPMPPTFSGKTLSPHEKDLITEWIQEGAKYGKLWSFEPIPKTVAVPQVKSSWPRNDIDRFVLARLQEEKLSPSPEANKLRWLRRVTLDLTGLPPKEAEMDAFLADKSAAAYEKVVDRLLDSNHFGERVASDWLDAARYSDSYGYQSDLIMPAWPYRDWVVRAFNSNMPYDRFLTDQIAGDLLPSPTRDERLATCFNRLHRQSNEGGSIPLEFKTEYAVDRVDTFGTAVLGLTVGCARCHDHKFDPITQKEYYQLFAYFNSIDEFGLLLSTEIVPTPSLLLPTPVQEAKLKELQEADAAAKRRLAETEVGAQSGFESWLAEFGNSNPNAVGPNASQQAKELPGLLAQFPLESADKDGKFASDVPTKVFAQRLGDVKLVPGHAGQAVQFDGDNGLAVRGLPGRERWDSFTWSFWVDDELSSPESKVLLHRTGGTDVGFCGFDLTIESGRLTARVMRAWPGNAVAVRTKHPIARGQWTQVAWSWDGGGCASGLKLYLDGKPADVEILNDKLWKRINAYGDLGPSGGDWAFGQRFRDAGLRDGKLDDIAFADHPLSDLEIAQLFDGHSLSDAIKAKDRSLLQTYADSVDPACKQAREDARKAQRDLANFEETIYEVPVMEESKAPIPAYQLARGRYDAPRNAQTLVQRGVPKSLPPLNASGSNNRLALAHWATRADNPLPARVAVNRFWQMLFGVGLVETSENFGIQGAQPTHPELLDYLARRFIDSGWNVKSLLKEMVLSATYRQDSARTDKLNKLDPDNRLLARGPSRRLTAEMIRDTVLAGSGLLNPKMGGPPVNPYQPAGIWQENNTMSPPFVQSKGRDLYRRSLYSTWKRTTPVPSMVLFDANSREACTVRRPSTDTPLQALVLLNDVQYVEAARVLADIVIRMKPDDGGRIRVAFRRLAGRDPDDRETAILVQTLKEQREVYDKDKDSAAKLIKEGDSKPTPSLSPVELAAMTVTVQEILNSDAVIWKR